MRLVCVSWKWCYVIIQLYSFSTLCMYVCTFHTCVYISGLVFDESQGPDVTLIPEKQKPKVSLSQDPKQAKVYYGESYSRIDHCSYKSQIHIYTTYIHLNSLLHT